MLFLSKDKSAQTISVLGITLRVRLSYWRFMSDLEWVLDGTCLGGTGFSAAEYGCVSLVGIYGRRCPGSGIGVASMGWRLRLSTGGSCPIWNGSSVALGRYLFQRGRVWVGESGRDL